MPGHCHHPCQLKYIFDVSRTGIFALDQRQMPGHCHHPCQLKYIFDVSRTGIFALRAMADQACESLLPERNLTFLIYLTQKRSYDSDLP